MVISTLFIFESKEDLRMEDSGGIGLDLRYLDRLVDTWLLIMDS